MTIQRFIVMTLAFAALTLAWCTEGTFRCPQPHRSGAPAWGYSGSNGPARWASLSPRNKLCAIGHYQSPINLVPEVVKNVSADAMEIELTKLENATMANTGLGLLVAPSNAGSLTWEETRHTPVLISIHVPAEHLDNGVIRPMEIQLWWYDENVESKVAMGIFVELRDDPENYGNPTASDVVLDLLARSCDVASPHAEALVNLDLTPLQTMLRASEFSSYNGSQTTPPCHEGIRWLISDQHVFVPVSIYNKARSVTKFNARFIQGVPGEPNVLQEDDD